MRVGSYYAPSRHIMLAKNISGEEIPAESVAFIASCDTVQDILNITKPPHSGDTRLVIVPLPIPANGIGRVLTNGEHRVQHELQDGETLLAGDRLGSATDVFILQKNQLGPFIVLKVIDDTTALVRFDYRRGQFIFTRTFTGSVAMPAQVWHFHPPLRFRTVSPGIAEIYIEGA